MRNFSKTLAMTITRDSTAAGNHTRGVRSVVLVHGARADNSVSPLPHVAGTRVLVNVGMAASTNLLQVLLMLAADWLQRQQAATIEYLRAENRVLRERLGRRRIVFTDVERRRLAEKARAVGRKVLHELGTIVTPDTLLRWHRELVARWTFVEKLRPAQPRTREELAALVVRMACSGRDRMSAWEPWLLWP
jgi:hypothetical protein